MEMLLRFTVKPTKHSSICLSRSFFFSSSSEQSKQSLPYLPKLTTLSLNGNIIDSLSLFLDALSISAPNLTNISLLKNPGVPGFSAPPEEVTRYRCYLVNRLPKLKYIDTSPVTETERKESRRVLTFTLSTPSAPTSLISPRPKLPSGLPEPGHPSGEADEDSAQPKAFLAVRSSVLLSKAKK
eukprot:TRINITY_DN7474_c0_g1_i1.p1 TRINITY_DN7474_c0_g1~~TRINITY_DN7474_c0_g1_i1.p1  ORF type:complete len:183 (-),score=38.08 TRINITY_DN7474_c0_g1_i1:3-551(-)